MSGMIASDAWVGSKHYQEMTVQPFDVFSSMGMLWEYLLTASIKYLMRAPTRKDNADCRQDLVKAIHCAQKALEWFDENS